MRDLSRVYKSKIKKILEGGYKIKFDNSTARNALQQIIYYYFVPIGNIHWFQRIGVQRFIKKVPQK